MSHATPDPARLMAVIRTQTDIAKLGLDLGAVMALVAERSQELTQADGAVIELAEGDDMVYRASAGIAKAQLGLRLNRSGSLSGLCVAQGHPLRCDDSEADDRVDRDACRRVGLRSMIVTPLKHADTVIGVLKVLSKHPARFSEADLQIIGMLSDQIAAAMYHATKYGKSELFYQATHDPLTGLANRALFYDRLRHQLSQAQRAAQPFALLNIDMDGLKAINDGHGHRAGDAAIRELASRLREASRESDTVARVGGDEFAVLLEAGSDRRNAETYSHRVRERFQSPFEFEQTPLAIGASIGVALFPEDGKEVEHLVERADQAMYVDKRSRKGSAGRAH